MDVKAIVGVIVIACMVAGCAGIPGPGDGSGDDIEDDATLWYGDCIQNPHFSQWVNDTSEYSTNLFSWNSDVGYDSSGWAWREGRDSYSLLVNVSELEDRDDVTFAFMVSTPDTNGLDNFIYTLNYHYSYIDDVFYSAKTEINEINGLREELDDSFYSSIIIPDILEFEIIFDETEEDIIVNVYWDGILKEEQVYHPVEDDFSYMGLKFTAPSIGDAVIMEIGKL